MMGPGISFAVLRTLRRTVSILRCVQTFCCAVGADVELSAVCQGCYGVVNVTDADMHVQVDM